MSSFGRGEGALVIRWFPWRWALVGILLPGGAGLFFLDRWAAEAATRSGRAAVNNEDYPQAIDHFNRAIQINPRCAPAYHGRGLAYFHQGDRDRAIADSGQAG
jgi:tetratricopeptide (TPR) repeat protein